MADYSTITIDGETRTIKDSVARAAATGLTNEFHYVCSNKITGSSGGNIRDCYREVIDELMGTSFGVGEPVLFTVTVDASKYSGYFCRTRSGTINGCTGWVCTESGQRYGIGLYDTTYSIVTYVLGDQLCFRLQDITTASGNGNITDCYQEVINQLLASTWGVNQAVFFTVHIDSLPSIFTGYFCRTRASSAVLTGASGFIQTERGYHYDFGYFNGSYYLTRAADYNQNSLDIGNVSGNNTGSPDQAYQNIIQTLGNTGYTVGRTVQFICTIDGGGRFTGRYTKTLQTESGWGCSLVMFSESGTIYSYGYLNGNYYRSGGNTGLMLSKGEANKRYRSTQTTLAGNGARIRVVNGAEMGVNESYRIEVLGPNKQYYQHTILCKKNNGTYTYVDVQTDTDIVLSMDANSENNSLYDVNVQNNMDHEVYIIVTPIIDVS